MAFLSSLSLSCSFFLLSTLVIMTTTTTTTTSMRVDGRMINTDDLVVSVESLFPKEVCVSSKDVASSGLKVVNRHGPCSPTNKQNLTRTQILNQDQLRVSWIRSRITGAEPQEQDQTLPLLAATEIPANKGDSFGSGGAYVVTVGFGTPSLQQTVIFDTGSDVTWIQCQPCVVSCYPQQQQIFDPTHSSTYLNISCASPHCASPELSASACSASGSTCVYGVRYGDGSSTQGYYSADTLALSSADTIQNFRFGCGQYQSGGFGRVAGLMGLGRAPSSVVSQAEPRYGGVFSYCLPPTSSSAGRLAFGSGSLPSNAQYTPMLSPGGGNMPFYFLELISIAVGGRKLAISPAVFSDAGTIIDSGTTVTQLPPAAYSALRAAFRARMSRYRRTAGAGPLDTCYDFSGVSSVALPTVVLEFRGASVSLVPNGIVYPVSSSKTCLAFAANAKDTDVGILGNVQQRTFDVVYDVPNLKIGFGPQGC